jgi:hypothetical protein
MLDPPGPAALLAWIAGLPLLVLEVAAGGADVMSNVASVITTTTNTAVASANSAVSIG